MQRSPARPNGPPFWFFDRYLTEIALLNAARNALQLVPQRIEIGVEPMYDGIRFNGRDDSTGHPEHILARQGNDPGTGATGTGLGLCLFCIIARAHENTGRHGNLLLSNDGGAVSSLWLP